MSGKYFYIACKSNGNMVLEIQGSLGPGSSVVLGNIKSGANSGNQLWFYDALSRSFRSKLNPSMCLEVSDSGGFIVVNPYVGNDTQRWKTKGDSIVRVSYPDKALDVKKAQYNIGQPMGQWDYHGKHNQQFSILPTQPEFFYIKSVGSGQVFDVKGRNKVAGTPVQLYKQKPRADAENQLWFEDHNGLIRSKLNNLALDSSGGKFTLQLHDPKIEWQRWTVQRSTLVHADRGNMVIAAANGPTPLVVTLYTEAQNQLWAYEYI